MLPSLDYDMKRFVCQKCGWKGYELYTTKTDKWGNILPLEKWQRGCPNCKTKKYIDLED